MGISGEEHDYLNQGCVPVYEQTKTSCCPSEWRCRKYYFHKCKHLVRYAEENRFFYLIK